MFAKSDEDALNYSFQPIKPFRFFTLFLNGSFAGGTHDAHPMIATAIALRITPATKPNTNPLIQISSPTTTMRCLTIIS
jgi:hypothetical protein